MQTQNKLKIAFFGTPDFSVQVLNRLEAGGIIPDLIITNPDEPTGRKLIITPPPVKIWATTKNIPVIQPENLKTIPIELEQDFDLFIVVAYGKIIPESILNLPKHGTLNVHPSLLPKYRGPSPIQTAILNGDNETGVSIMLLDKEMDHGPTIAQEKITLIDWNPYSEELRSRLAIIAGNLLKKIIPDWIGGKVKAIPQDHSLATFTKKIAKDDGYINPNLLLSDGRGVDNESEMAWRKIRALNPDPGAYTVVEAKNGQKTRIKIIRAKFENNKLTIEKVIPEGKKEMGWEDWKRGNIKEKN